MRAQVIGCRNGLIEGRLITVSMKVDIPEPLASRLAAAAEAQGVTAQEVAVDTLAEHFGEARRRLGFAAVGASTSGRRAADAEATLAEDGFGIDSADR